jgi:hypothetical protein
MARDAPNWLRLIGSEVRIRTASTADKPGERMTALLREIEQRERSSSRRGDAGLWPLISDAVPL